MPPVFEADFGAEEVDYKCDDCEKTLTKDQVYPKAQDGWASGITICKCAACWNKNVQQEIIPMMEERAQQQQRDSNSNVNKPCRCGSTTHKTTRHSDCPLNKKNLVQVPNNDKEDASPKKRQRKETAVPASPTVSKYKVGDRVDGFYGGWSGPRLFFAGQITCVHDNGTYDILYDDGDKEFGVIAEFIQPEEVSKANSPPPPEKISDSPHSTELPPPPVKPLGRQRSKNALLGRTFYDEGTVDDGKVIFQPGEFVVKKVLGNGRLLCVRKANIQDSEQYLVNPVREMVVEYEKKMGMYI